MKNKVRLRKYKESDLQFLHELLSDELTKKFFPFMYTSSIEQSDLRLRTRISDQNWGFSNRAVIEDFWSRKPVGEISGKYDKEDKTKMELSIMIHPKHRGKGYAKLGTLAFISKMIKENPELKTFILEIAKHNYASQEVAKKLEFRLNLENSKFSQNTLFWEKGRDEF